MNCSPNSHHPDLARLQSYLDNELAAAEQGAIGRHIEACADCEARLKQLTDLLVEQLPLVPICANEADPTPERNGAPLPLPSEWPALPGYKILSVLGAGGMGVVFLALHARLKRHVALKVIRADADLRARARFRTEAEAMARLQHSNIIPIFEVGEHRGRPFFAMEYLVGGSLSKRVGDAPQEPKAAAQMVQILARAMHYAHQRGVVHRDLKPANILLAGPLEPTAATSSAVTASLLPDSSNVKITDFGVARIVDAEEMQTRLTLPEEPIGTPSYMSPEQAAGKVEEIGTLTDVYALGAVLYKMLTGHAPFAGATRLEIIGKVRSADHFPVRPSHYRSDVPRDLEAICLKCLEKDSSRRYHTAEQLADELGRFDRGEPLLHTRPVGRLERLRRWCRRKPALATAIGLAVTLLVAAIAGPIGFAVQAYKHTRELNQTLNELQCQLARNRLDQGLNLCEQGNGSYGLLKLAQSLRTLPYDAGDLERLIRLNLAAWRPHVSTLTVCLHHPGDVRAVSLSPDGRTLATGCADGFARLWNVATEQPVCPPLAHQGKVLAVAFSADGKTLLTGGADGTARLWQAATGQPLGIVLRPGGPVRALAFSPDGRTILTSANQKEAQLWDAATGKAIGLPCAIPNRCSPWPSALMAGPP